MNETVDKATDKLMASIQKSQNTPENKTTEAASSEATPKPKTRRKPAEKKAVEAVAVSSPIDSPRKFVGNLRWPD